MSGDLYVARRDIPADCLYDVCGREGDFEWGVSKGRRYTTSTALSGLYAAYHVSPRHDLNGLTGGEAARRITEALAAIRRTDRGMLVDRYETSHATVAAAILWLTSVRDYCVRHPDYVVSC